MPMYDTASLFQAGLTPNGKFAKYGNAIDQDGNVIVPNPLKYNLDYNSMFNIMRVQNFVETIERYQWVNVPYGLTQDLIERLLFFRGKGVFYFNDKVDKFQFLPFSLNGVIDEYGRFTACNTHPFTGVAEEDNSKKKSKTELLIYENLDLVYDLPYNEEQLKDINEGKTVGIILNDNSLMLSQQPVIRSNYVTPVLRMMATLMAIINTAMFGCADHSVIRVENEGELASINDQIDAINLDIIRAKRFTPIVAKLPIESLKTNNTANLEGLFNTFNSLNNFLKSITGVANAGVFDKKAHLLQSEQELNGSNADDVYYNGLRLRQEFCLMVQAYYGYPIWCESKRCMTEAQQENYLEGETNDPDNTQQIGGNENASN